MHVIFPGEARVVPVKYTCAALGLAMGYSRYAHGLCMCFLRAFHGPSFGCRPRGSRQITSGYPPSALRMPAGCPSTARGLPVGCSWEILLYPWDARGHSSKSNQVSTGGHWSYSTSYMLALLIYVQSLYIHTRESRRP